MGGGGSSDTTQTVIQELPDYARPYFERLLGRTEAQSLEPYQPYGGSRLASSDQFADIGASQDIVRGLSGVPGLGLAQSSAQQAMQQAQQSGFTPGQFDVSPITAAGQFDTAAAQQYMSPYIQSVIERQQQDAQLQFERQRAGRNAAAVGAGAFGGSRQGVQEGMAEEALSRQMGDITASGMQRAYEQAQSQFGADRQAQLQAEQAMAGELGRTQQLGEASRQFGSSQGLAALQAQLAAGAQFAGLGEQERAAGIQDAQLLEAIGRQQQAEAQAGLDIGYQDFLAQRGYTAEQIAMLSSVLRGLPIAPTGTQTTQMPTNPLAETLGAGLTGLSLYRAFT
jgi:hypothetical protein